MNNNCQNLNVGNLRNGPNQNSFRHPRVDDEIGKKMYYENGHCLGQFNGTIMEYGELRAKVVGYHVAENGYQITYPVEYMYVQISPITGGKSRRRRTKKTRRGKSKRRGRKTRRQRR